MHKFYDVPTKVASFDLVHRFETSLQGGPKCQNGQYEQNFHAPRTAVFHDSKTGVQRPKLSLQRNV